MSLLLLGISHHSAPLEVRERLALPDEGRVRAALGELLQVPGVGEGLILSTCNRVEILVDEDGRVDAARLFAFLIRITDATPAPPASLFYELRGEAAARHVMRVAASLDSVVIGEPQILGQLKQAYVASQETGAIGSELDALLTRAFHAAKRVRSETGIAHQPVSVSTAAVELAHQIFGGLSHKTVLLLGAGEMGTAAAQALVRQGATRLLVTNRTLSRAQFLATKFGGEAFPLEDLRERAELADIVISCTGAPHPLLDRHDVSALLTRRRGRPMLFLDVAVPRDIDPTVHQLDNAFVYNVDDLDKVVNSNLAERRKEAQSGETIIEAELSLYAQHREQRELVPTLRALQDHAESLRAAEWQRMRKRLGPLTPAQEEAIETLTRGLMQKWLHHPLSGLKAAATPAERAAMIELVQRLFALDAESPIKTEAIDAVRAETSRGGS